MLDTQAHKHYLYSTEEASVNLRSMYKPSYLLFEPTLFREHNTPAVVYGKVITNIICCVSSHPKDKTENTFSSYFMLKHE